MCIINDKEQTQPGELERYRCKNALVLIRGLREIQEVSLSYELCCAVFLAILSDVDRLCAMHRQM